MAARLRSLRVLLLIVTAALTLLSGGCSGGAKNTATVTTPSPSVVASATPAVAARAGSAAASPTPPSASPTQAAVAGGSDSSAQLSDCEAIKRVRAIGQRLSGLNIRQWSSLTPASPPEAKDAVVKSLELFDTSLGQFVSDLRGLTVAPEFRPLRDTYATAYGDLRQVIPDLKAAAAAGDSPRLLQRFGKGADDASARIKQYEQANPELMKRIDATTCP